MPGEFICKVISITKLLRGSLVSPFLPPSITHYLFLFFQSSDALDKNYLEIHTPKIFIPGFDANRIW